MTDIFAVIGDTARHDGGVMAGSEAGNHQVIAFGTSSDSAGNKQASEAQHCKKGADLTSTPLPTY